jgi:hypothetical protein
LSQSPGKDNSRRYDNPCLIIMADLGVDGRSLTISFLLVSNHNDVPGRGWSVRIASGGVSELNLQGFKIHSFIRGFFFPVQNDEPIIHLSQTRTSALHLCNLAFLVQHLGQWNQCFYFLLVPCGWHEISRSFRPPACNATLATQLSQALLNVNQRCRSPNGHKQGRAAK